MTAEKRAELESMTASERVARDDRLRASIGETLPDGPYPWFDKGRNLWARVHLMNPHVAPKYMMRPDGNLSCGWTMEDSYVDVLVLYLWYDVDQKIMRKAAEGVHLVMHVGQVSKMIDGEAKGWIAMHKWVDSCDTVSPSEARKIIHLSPARHAKRAAKKKSMGPYDAVSAGGPPVFTKRTWPGRKKACPFNEKLIARKKVFDKDGKPVLGPSTLHLKMYPDPEIDALKAKVKAAKSEETAKTILFKQANRNYKNLLDDTWEDHRMEPKTLLHFVVNAADAEALRKILYMTVLNDDEALYTNARLRRLAHMFHDDAFDEAQIRNDVAQMELFEATRKVHEAQDALRKAEVLGNLQRPQAEAQKQAQPKTKRKAQRTLFKDAGPQSKSPRKRKNNARAPAKRAGAGGPTPRKRKRDQKHSGPTPPKEAEEGFVNKPHYIVGPGHSRYKGINLEKRNNTNWRVKYKSSTICRCATLAEACEAYAQHVHEHGHSSSRHQPDVIEIIESLEPKIHL